MSYGANTDIEPTFTGFIETTHDALIIINLCLLRQLDYVQARIGEGDRDRLIRSGSVFVFDESAAGIRRWTDGLTWSPSRICGNFLVYREMPNRPSNRGKGKAIKDATPPDGEDGAWTGSGSGRSTNRRRMAARSGNDTTSPYHARERELLGSLTDDSRFKPDGLVKRTMSIGSIHLISYFRLSDVVPHARFSSPSSQPELAAFEIDPSLLDSSHFRVPPAVEIDPSGVVRYRGEGVPRPPCGPVNELELSLEDAFEYGLPSPVHGGSSVGTGSSAALSPGLAPRPLGDPLSRTDMPMPAPPVLFPPPKRLGVSTQYSLDYYAAPTSAPLPTAGSSRDLGAVDDYEVTFQHTRRRSASTSLYDSLLPIPPPNHGAVSSGHYLSQSYDPRRGHSPYSRPLQLQPPPRSGGSSSLSSANAAYTTPASSVPSPTYMTSSSAQPQPPTNLGALGFWGTANPPWPNSVPWQNIGPLQQQQQLPPLPPVSPRAQFAWGPPPESPFDSEATYTYGTDTATGLVGYEPRPATTDGGMVLDLPDNRWRPTPGSSSYQGPSTLAARHHSPQQPQTSGGRLPTQYPSRRDSGF